MNEMKRRRSVANVHPCAPSMLKIRQWKPFFGLCANPWQCKNWSVAKTDVDSTPLWRIKPSIQVASHWEHDKVVVHGSWGKATFGCHAVHADDMIFWLTDILFTTLFKHQSPQARAYSSKCARMIYRPSTAIMSNTDSWKHFHFARNDPDHESSRSYVFPRLTSLSPLTNITDPRTSREWTWAEILVSSLHL